MREILFRGKRTDNGEWVEGLLYKEYNKFYTKFSFCIQRINKFGIPIAVYEIDPETVGEFTGLTDKNGKRIFEGDILKNEEGYIFDREYKNEVVFGGGEYYGLGFCDFEARDFKLCAVIGNIHDNPELLKGEGAE